MYWLGSLVFMFYQQLSQAFPAPVDTVIVQIQQWGVGGGHRVTDQVLLNGVSFTNTDPEIKSIVRILSADALLPALISINQTSPMRNHTILYSRECILEGSQLVWTDRVFYDGKLYLTLDHSDMWMTHVPQALALKELWDQQVQGGGTRRQDMEECCIKLMRELKLSETQSDPVSEISLLQFLIPCLALLIFSGLMITSFLISKNNGLRHPGGVIGSIIHYPKDLQEADPGKKGNNYQAL